MVLVCSKIALDNGSVVGIFFNSVNLLVCGRHLEYRSNRLLSLSTWGILERKHQKTPDLPHH